MADYNLDYLLAQVRRIEEHREKGTEAKIRKNYQEILKELRHYLADTYSQYAEDDKLTYEILQRHSRYARFLNEVEKKINDLSPETKRLIRSTVEQVYEHTYNGMIDAVQDRAQDVVSGLKGCTQAILRRAVENPVSKLTLNDRLEKHRKEIIYDIKQAITVGLMNGDRYSTMAGRIKQSVDGSYKKAIRISRTETHRVREAGNLDAAGSVQEALSSGNVPLQMMKVWKTMKDERVRPAKQKGRNKQYDHRKMDGVAVKIDEEFTLPSGAKTMAPGQSGVAGEDINCRCYLSYELRKADEAPIGPAQQRERGEVEKEIPTAKLGAGQSDGEVPGTPQLLGQIDPANTDQAIEYYNGQIRNELIEHAFVIDRVGNVYYSVGSEDAVSLDGINLEGATVTHNHPESNGIVSFGEDDFGFMKMNQSIKEMQCVNPKFTYKAQIVKDITNVTYNEIYLESFKYALEPDFEAQDAAMRVLAERGYIQYERIKVKP